MTRSPHILMCPPEYFGIEYEINPWMNRRRPADRALATRQWCALRQIIEAAGAEVSCLSPAQGLPDQVFTANAGLVYRDVAIVSRFRHEERQGEEAHNALWFAQRGFRVRRLPGGVPFEGAGDALFCGDTLLAGYRIRSDVAAHEEVGRMLGCRVIPIELIDSVFYHLDTCFCPITSTTAIYYPGAFDRYGRTVLQEMIPDLVPVSEAESRHFACNAVVLDHTVVTNTGCAELRRELNRRGFATLETPLGEFVKAGGSAKCLTLRLDGEEAAAWAEDPVA